MNQLDYYDQETNFRSDKPMLQLMGKEQVENQEDINSNALLGSSAELDDKKDHDNQSTSMANSSEVSEEDKSDLQVFNKICYSEESIITMSSSNSSYTYCGVDMKDFSSKEIVNHPNIMNSTEQQEIIKVKPLWKNCHSDKQKRRYLDEETNTGHPFLKGIPSNAISQRYLLPIVCSSRLPSQTVICSTFRLDTHSVSMVAPNLHQAIPYDDQDRSLLSFGYRTEPIVLPPEGKLIIDKVSRMKSKRRKMKENDELFCPTSEIVVSSQQMVERSEKELEFEILTSFTKGFIPETPPESIEYDQTSNQSLEQVLLSLRNKSPPYTSPPSLSSLSSVRDVPPKKFTSKNSHRTVNKTKKSIPIKNPKSSKQTNVLNSHKKMQHPPSKEINADSIPFSSFPCSCKKSRCLKLYCECFAADKYCNGCKCISCMNTSRYFHFRQEAIVHILSKKPDAFLFRQQPQQQLETKIISKGCNCKKSNCLKKYCECFLVNTECSEKCHCKDCKNIKNSPEQLIARQIVEKKQKQKEDLLLSSTWS